MIGGLLVVGLWVRKVGVFPDLGMSLGVKLLKTIGFDFVIDILLELRLVSFFIIIL